MLLKKLFKLKPLFLTLILINNNYVMAKKIDNINEIYVFGDSLSFSGDPDDDYGHLRYIPGGSQHPSYVDLISLKFTNKKSRNYLFGGTSYAQPGTKITKNFQYPNLQTDRNIDILLKSKNYSLDPNSIYLFAIGGGDINNSIIFDILYNILNTITGSFLLPKNLQIGTILKNNNETDLIKYRPKVLVDLVNKIGDYGAKDIIFINPPDASLAPINILFHIDILLTAFSLIKINLDFIKEAIGKKIDKQIRVLTNNDPDIKGKNGIKEYAIKSFQIQYPVIPKFMLEKLYETIYSIVNNRTSIFNKAVYQSLIDNVNRNLNILYLDLDNLFKEVINNPKQYGIDNIVIPSCTLGFKAPNCTNDKIYHNDGVHYLFGDWFHPSEYGNKIMASYVISSFNASIYVSSLANHLYSKDVSNDLIISNQLNNNRILKPNREYIHFISYSASLNGKNEGSYVDKTNLNNNLNLGSLYNINENLTLGAMLTTSLGKYEPFKEFKYNYNLFGIDLFTQYNINNKLWFEASTGFSYLKAKDLKRTIDFNTGRSITEKSNGTHAISYDIKSLFGYDFVLTDKYILSPIIGYTYGKYKVNAFREQGNRSTAMYFKNFNKKVSFATAGFLFNINNIDKKLKFNSEISYNIPVSQRQTKIKSAINSSSLLFERITDIKNDKWLSVKLGANKTFKKINASANIEYRNIALKNNKFNYAITISNKF